jgi:hypothetical protein
MKNITILTFALWLLCCSLLQAQDKLSWRKHVKLADELYANAHYADAGEHYRAAFKQRPKNKELAYKAGLCFSIIRDYRNAADNWAFVRDFNDDFPLIGLHYARALKQNGDYETANNEFNGFLSRYSGTDKPRIDAIVQNELRGCELAARLATQGAKADASLQLMNTNVNTPETEFAPLPYNDEVLYFSSTMAQRAEIYRSVKSEGAWGKAAPIENFPNIPKSDHFCNGSLNPNGTRFYFTICKSVEEWGGLTTHCEIYVTRRSGQKWSAPERLPDYINEPGVTTTQPFVIHQNGTEILYFSSNRTGGTGGMDIWYSTREVSSNANDFTLPINCGTSINTLGDDITPFYDAADRRLYFASNGHVSIGGLDIFSAKGERTQWQAVENLGLPFNSAADDFSYAHTPSGKSAFLVSNRIFGTEKVTTTQEDIFEISFSNPLPRWVTKGEVFDKNSRDALKSAEVAIYEVQVSNQRRFLTKMDAMDGKYHFSVEPNKQYYLEAMAPGYFPTHYEFDTRDFDKFTDFGAPLYLEPYSNGAATKAQDQPPTQKPAPANIPPKAEPIEEQAKPTLNPETPEIRQVPAAEPTAEKAPAAQVPAATTGQQEAPYVSKSKADQYQVVTEAPRKIGTYYKIQLIALSKNLENLDHPRFKAAKELGRLEREYIMDNKLCRVLLADYSSVEEASKDLQKVRKMRDFGGAFIVEYKDGERMRTIDP